MKITSGYDRTHVLWEGDAATLREAVESAVRGGAYLRGAYLRGAYLSGTYLRGANLSGTDLSGTDLSGAYLRGAYLRGAYLGGANLSGTDLSGTDLSGANLSGTDLRGADLSGAYLRDAYLSGTDLRGAELGDAYGADYSAQPTIVRLPVGDPRGYDCIAQWDGAQWMVMAGCRRFTVAEAAEHWGASYRGDRAIGDRYLFALGCLTGVEPPREVAP